VWSLKTFNTAVLALAVSAAALIWFSFSKQQVIIQGRVAFEGDFYLLGYLILLKWKNCVQD